MNCQEYTEYYRDTLKPLEYPYLHLETYGFCNARCVFCGYRSMTRPKGKMSMQLIDKILDEVSSWKQPCREIVPVHYGEFFLNPDWHLILQKINEKLPNTKIAVPTNFSCIDENVIAKLKTVKNLLLSFSAYAYFDETYERLIGLPKENLHRLRGLLEALSGSGVTVSLGASANIISDLERDLLTQQYGSLISFHNLTTNKDINGNCANNPIDVPCSMIYGCMVILWNGEVCACCYDPNGRNIVGDVNKQSVLEVWRSMDGLRELHRTGKRGTIELCGSCSYAMSLEQVQYQLNIEKGVI